MARSFNGTSDLIAVSPPAGDSSLNINVGAWIKTSATNGAIISSDTGTSPNRILQFKVSSGAILFILFTTSTAHQLSSVGTVNDGAWHHVAGIYDGTTMRIYIDGVADGTLVTGTNRSFASHSVRIGAHLAGITQSFFSGSMSEAFVRYSGLSVGEVKALAAGLPASHIAPDHYWPLWGKDSPEPDIGIGSHITGTLTGTSVANAGRIGRKLLTLA